MIPDTRNHDITWYMIYDITAKHLCHSTLKYNYLKGICKWTNCIKTMVSSNYAIKCLVKNRNKLRAGFFSCQLFRFLTVINDSGIACIYTASHNAPIRYFDKNLFFFFFFFFFPPSCFSFIYGHGQKYCHSCTPEFK